MIYHHQLHCKCHVIIVLEIFQLFEVVCPVHTINTPSREEIKRLTESDTYEPTMHRWAQKENTPDLRYIVQIAEIVNKAVPCVCLCKTWIHTRHKAPKSL